MKKANDPRGWSIKNREGETIESGFASYSEAARAIPHNMHGILFPVSN